MPIFSYADTPRYTWSPELLRPRICHGSRTSENTHDVDDPPMSCFLVHTIDHGFPSFQAIVCSPRSPDRAVRTMDHGFPSFEISIRYPQSDCHAGARFQSMVGGLDGRDVQKIGKQVESEALACYALLTVGLQHGSRHENE
jgi:hypothetical protein